MNRFYVQERYVHGLALIDRERSSLVVSSFGDKSEDALERLEKAARCLNAATSNPGDTDAFKGVHPSLYWRIIEHLAYCYRDARRELDDLEEYRGGYIGNKVWGEGGEKPRADV